MQKANAKSILRNRIQITRVFKEYIVILKSNAWGVKKLKPDLSSNVDNDLVRVLIETRV